MNDTYKIDREFLFKTSIYEITSISIEHNYDINGSNVEGEFIISGDYRLHEISINKEDFSFKIPFKHEIRSNINLDSVAVDITDFNYEFKNEDELEVHIEYVVCGDESIIEFEDEKSLDEFLSNNNAEVIDLSDAKELASNDRNNTEENSQEIIEVLEESDVESTQEDKDAAAANKNEASEGSINENMILNSISGEDSYVKYHIHIVTANDTIESICNKYNVSLNTLKQYNTFENLELNSKLLIPENEEC